MTTSPSGATAQPAFVTAARQYRERALRSIGYGVSSTPRGNQRPAPIVAEHAEQAHIYDITGTRFIDYSLGYGPLILGHSPKPVLDAVSAELSRGLRTATVHQGEAELGELLQQTLPSAEISALVSTGSEAVQLALRVARAATGKLKVVKFRGNYHGWFDNVHVAGSPSNDGPSTIGQDLEAASSLVLADWGDTAAIAPLLNAHDDIAAVLLEAAAVNGGCFAPPPGFLETLRTETARRGIVLIFDEVITGYRLSLGGAQQLYGITPDLSVIGKAMGAGFPISAISGSRAVMEPLASGKLLHRGTFNGNPISVAASIACIRHLQTNANDIYPRMNAQAEALCSFVRQHAEEAGLALRFAHIGSALQFFMGVKQLDKLTDVGQVNAPATQAFAGELALEGVQTLPRGLMYLSAAHSDEDIAATQRAFANVIEKTVRTQQS